MLGEPRERVCVVFSRGEGEEAVDGPGTSDTRGTVLVNLTVVEKEAEPEGVATTALPLLGPTMLLATETIETSDSSRAFLRAAS